MKWTYDWLKDYLKTDADAATIGDTLTRIGLEVDDVITPVAPVAAKIVECVAHPDSDHLHVLKVDDGTGALRQVVCGAPNARVGLISALARPGCVIDGHEIKSGKLRGVVSDGMMCSERELGIGDDHSGIMEMSADTQIGAPVVPAPTVFDAGITPNRPDYLALRGIARDLAAAGVGEYIAPNDTELSPVATSRRAIVETDKCAVYRFCEINNITVNKSNAVVAARLAAIGINPKNAPVDATNYICYDMGQPMHCFDADEIRGDIVVRMAAEGEQFTDLFDATHELKSTDIVIADAAGILALAGVVGGARGMTTDATKNIILESAYFDPVSVRKTAKRLGISTDASYRYERGIDPTITGVALARAARIIMDACGGEIVGVGMGGANNWAPIKIAYSPDLFCKKTGVEMDTATQREILEKLGYEISCDGDAWTVTPRPARVDVEIPETVVADLIRIYGYETIAATRTRPAMPIAHTENFETTLKRALAARGLNEIKSFGFGNSATEELLSDAPVVKIANPITTDLDTARNSLLGGILTAVANNEKRGFADLNLFAVGSVFYGMDVAAQRTQLCIVRTGATSPRHWAGRSRGVDIFDAKADLIALMHGQRFTVSSDNPPRWAHPFRYGAIWQGKKKIAEFGQLHPMVAKKLRIKTNVVIAIADDIENLPRGRGGRKIAMSEYQPIMRDFAFIVAQDTPAGAIVAAAQSADNRITDTVVFDAFDMPDGTRSIAITITITPTDNMSDADLATLQSAVIKRVEEKCDAHIRDK